MRGTLMLAASAGMLLAGCAPPDPVPPPDTVVEGRPADGLLHRGELQHLVELQLRRDAGALAQRLDDPDPVIRARAAFALGSVQDTSVAPQLLAALHDLDPRVRADAAFAVGQLPMPGVATPLFNALKVEWDRRAQEAQLDALGKRCQEAAAVRLFQIDDPALAPLVSKAMGRCVLGGVAEDTLWARLITDLVNPDAEVREWAAYAFGRYQSPWRWDRLRIPVRRALRIYPTADPATMHLTRALGRAVDRESMELLGWWMEHGVLWETRANAVGGIAQAGGMAAAVWLFRGLEDPSVQVRLQAALGVAQLPPAPDVAGSAADWIAAHPGAVAESAPLLAYVARSGNEAAVEAWFRRPDLREERVLLAAIDAARELPGLRGVELLGEAGTVTAGRAQRAALDALRERWAASRPYPETHETYRAALAALVISRDPVVSRGAGELLQDTAFVDPEAALSVAPPGGDGLSGETGGDEEGRALPPYRLVDWDRLRALGSRPHLHLETDGGRVVIALHPEEAPLTVDAVAATAAAGRYDGVPFHRVVPNFVAQGGDVTRGGVEPEAGFRLRSEFTRIPYGRGVVGMASAGKDTETTQFFITHSPQPHLDGAYTAFGHVVDGMEVVDRITPEDRILRAWVVPGG